MSWNHIYCVYTIIHLRSLHIGTVFQCEVYGNYMLHHISSSCFSFAIQFRAYINFPGIVSSLSEKQKTWPITNLNGLKGGAFCQEKLFKSSFITAY